MPINSYPRQIRFDLLSEPEDRFASFVTSTAFNLAVLAFCILIGMAGKQVIEQHRYEQMVIVIPSMLPSTSVTNPKPPRLPEPPKTSIVKFQAPRIIVPRPEPMPNLKPIQMETKMIVPVTSAARLSVIEAPQPKAALAAAAAPALAPQSRLSTAPVHFGSLQGVIPNPNSTRPANIGAIGNPYGGMAGQAVSPRGLVGSTGLGNGTNPGSSAGVVGKVAFVGIAGGNGTAARNRYGNGKVASTNIPAMTTAVAAPKMVASVFPTKLEVLFKPPVQYNPEAKQLRVQGDVILRVTFTAAGQVIVDGVLHGLGHGLDDEARRVAREIRFHPATINGRAVDTTTNITITFQLA
jgi:TonB family protein